MAVHPSVEHFGRGSAGSAKMFVGANQKQKRGRHHVTRVSAKKAIRVTGRLPGVLFDLVAIARVALITSLILVADHSTTHTADHSTNDGTLAHVACE